jgi:hypothetical protein
VAGTSKLVTMPGAGAVGIGRNAVNVVRFTAKRRPKKVGQSLGEGLVLHPIDSVVETTLHPIKHGVLSVKHFCLTHYDTVMMATNIIALEHDRLWYKVMLQSSR